MTTSSDSAWQVDDGGWLPAVIRAPSPNHDARPPGETISLIVIHAISLPPGEFGSSAVADFFCNRLDPAAHSYFSRIAGQRVSAHFFIRRDGTVVQFVSCLNRAWHAGVSCWRGRERCNDFSLGIELEGDDRTDFTVQQYESLVRLKTSLHGRFHILDCVGHADIAPGRKTDPGPHFDWAALQ